MSEVSDQYYSDFLRSFDKAVAEAIRVSQAAAGRKAEPRAWWASVLFTRLCTFSVSLLSLVPGSRFAPKHFEHFDCASALSLCRNIVDAYFVFFYLCIDAVSVDEWKYRLTLLQLHDCVTRMTMFREFDPADDSLDGFELQATELRNELATLAPFRALPEKQQRHRLKGDTAIYLSQNELLERMEVERGNFRGLYRFLSAHVHTLPLGFYRMAERNQGRGIESDTEKGYIGLALEVAEATLRRATAEMLTVFPDIGKARSPEEGDRRSERFANPGKR